ncbi:MAG: hypothetical protein ACRC8Y_13040 [Chroococcales cyanobacterium]
MKSRFRDNLSSFNPRLVTDLCLKFSEFFNNWGLNALIVVGEGALARRSPFLYINWLYQLDYSRLEPNGLIKSSKRFPFLPQNRKS